MKIQKPMTPVDYFEAAYEIIAHSHFKIFTPNWRYFRRQHQLVAAKTFASKKLFLLQLREETLVARHLPPSYGAEELISRIERELGIKIQKAKPLFRLTYDDPWDGAGGYIAPSDRIEFNLFV